jgi:hypothetical protein
MRVPAVMRYSLPRWLLPALLPWACTPLLTQRPEPPEERGRPTVIRVQRSDGSPWADARVELISRLQPWDFEFEPERRSLVADARGRVATRLKPWRLYSAFAWAKAQNGLVSVSQLEEEMLPGFPVRLRMARSGLQRALFRAVGHENWEGKLEARVLLRSRTRWAMDCELNAKAEIVLPVVPGPVFLEVFAGDAPLHAQRVEPLREELFVDEIRLPEPVEVAFRVLRGKKPLPGAKVMFAPFQYHHASVSGPASRLYLRQNRRTAGFTNDNGRFSGVLPVSRSETGDLDLRSLSRVRLAAGMGEEYSLSQARIDGSARLDDAGTVHFREDWRIPAAPQFRIALQEGAAPTLACFSLFSRPGPRQRQVWTPLREGLMSERQALVGQLRAGELGGLLLLAGRQNWIDCSEQLQRFDEQRQLRVDPRDVQRVRVRASYSDGKPIRVGRLWFWRGDAKQGNGREVLGTLPVGPADVDLAPGRYYAELWDGKLGLAVSDSFEVRGKAHPPIELTLRMPRPVRLEGRVLGPKGEAVAGAHVFLEGSSRIHPSPGQYRVIAHLEQPEVRTDPQGRFVLELPSLPRNYFHLAARRGGVPRDGLRSVTEAWFAHDEDRKDIEIRLRR